MLRKLIAAGVLLAALVTFSACSSVQDVVSAMLGSGPEILRPADAALGKPQAFDAEPQNTLIEYMLGWQGGLTGAAGDFDTPFLVASPRIAVVFTACSLSGFPIYLGGGRALALGGGLAVLARDGKTLVYDLDAPGSGPVWTLDGEPDAAWISPDGSRVALLSGDTLRVYDGANGKALGQVKAGARVEVSFARDGSMVAADGARAALVRPDGTTAWTYAPETRGGFHATLAPDGSAVYIAADGRLEALDLNGLMGQAPRKAVLWRVDVPSGLSAGRIAVSNDGKWLATPLSDGSGLVLASSSSPGGRAAWRVPAPGGAVYVSSTFADGRAAFVAVKRDGTGPAAVTLFDPASGGRARVILAPKGAKALYPAGAWIWTIATAPFEDDPTRQPVALGYRFAPVGCAAGPSGGSEGATGARPGQSAASGGGEGETKPKASGGSEGTVQPAPSRETFRVTVKTGRPLSPAVIEARVGQRVTLVFRNGDEDAEHEIAIEDWGVDVKVPPGGSASVTVTPKEPGTGIVRCVEPGHGREVGRWFVTR